jgi:hypothetical protein
VYLGAWLVCLSARAQYWTPPSNPPEQMFPMPGSRFFLKHLPELLAQTC